MAVYQGARLRSGALPAANTEGRQVRAASPATAPTAPRVRPMGLLIAGIVVATLLGLAYLTQTLGSNATTSEIRELERERLELQKEVRRHAVYVLRGAEADEIKARARKLDLKPLGDAVVLTTP